MSDPLMPLPTRQGLVARVQGILLKPAETWDIIAAEPATIQSIFMGYVVPLAAIGPICHVIGTSLVGVGMFGVSYHAPLLWSIVSAVVAYGLELVSIYLMALIVDALAPNFGGQRDRLAAFKLVAYSGTAGYIAGIFGLLPMLGILAILLALYGIYLFYLGLPKLMKNPADKSIIYLIIVALCRIFLAVVVGMIVGWIALMGVGAAALGAGGLAAGAPGGTFTVHDKNGSATVNLNQMAAAANQDTAASGPVKVADASALLALMPPIFDGATRADTSTSSGGVGGINASTAEASYTVDGGTIRLKLADVGSMSGITAMANAMNVNASSSSAGGYETTKTDGNRMTNERYNSTSKSGEYSIMQDGRITVSAEGSNVDMATLKALVSQIDLGKAEALTR